MARQLAARCRRRRRRRHGRGKGMRRAVRGESRGGRILEVRACSCPVWTPLLYLKLGLIFCFTKPPMRGGFVHHNIDRHGQDCYFVHQNPLIRGFRAKKYHGLQGSHIIPAGKPGRARPCRTETAGGKPGRDYRAAGRENKSGGQGHRLPATQRLA